MKIIVGVIIAVIIAIGGFVLMNKNDNKTVSDTTTPPSNATNAPETEAPTDGRPANDDSVPEASQSSTVAIENSAFTPSKITIKKGTTVTWTNNDDMQHDVTPDDPTDEFKKSALLSKGGTYSVTFNTPGTYTYHCTPHPFMKGTVEVTE
jgi:amicyanin